MNRTTLTSVLAALLVTATGCSGASDPAPATTTPASTTASATTPSGPVAVTDAWVKAVPQLGEHPMTGVFGTIQNTTGAPVTITSVTNSVSQTTEIHETVTTGGRATMQRIDGGLTLEPGAARELRPGGDHIMVMDLTSPLPPGHSVTITLTTSDGQTMSFEAVAKTFSGGDEKYHSGDAPGGGTHGPSGEAPATAPATP